MSLIDGALRAVGAFYMFAGFVLLRAILTSRIVDAALVSLGGTPDRAGDAKANWHIAMALIIFAGGVTLALLLDVSAWLFTGSALLQAFYLVWLAPRWFDLTDPPDATGRRQSTNAFLIYAAATALVLWAAQTGRLARWQDTPWPLLASAMTAFAMLALYAGRHALFPLSDRGAGADWARAMADDDTPLDVSRVRCIKVMAEIDCHPLWVLDEGRHANVDPADLGLSADLCRDLEAWSAAYSDSVPMAAVDGTEEQASDHAAGARPLAERIASERPDLVVYVLEPPVGVVQVHPKPPATP